jgi:hypothetical protein
MSLSSESLLGFWEWFATVGFVSVIIGVIVEGVEHFRKFPKKEHTRQLHIEKIGWFVVVGGLAMEFLGDQFANRIKDERNAKSNERAAIAEKQMEGLRKDAGEAMRQAGQANERAGSFEKEAEELRSTNLLLQSRVLELQNTLQPRRITQEQRDQFIALLKDTPKIPVRVFMGAYDAETIAYARQIRGLLDDAGYGNGTPGITSIGDDTIYVSNIGDVGQDAPFHFVFFGDHNKPLDWGNFRITRSAFGIQGIAAMAYSGPKSDPAIIPELIDKAFLKVGIRAGIDIQPDFPNLKTEGDWGIWIPQKF